MRLSSIRVRNFRSIVDTQEFPVTPLFGLVGENNTGKSTILRAVEMLLSAGVGGVTKRDFREPDAPITIRGTFDQLSNSEKKRWRPYLVGGALSLEKHFTVSTDEKTGKERVDAEYHGYQAEPSSWHLSIGKIMARFEGKPQ